MSIHPIIFSFSFFFTLLNLYLIVFHAFSFEKRIRWKKKSFEFLYFVVCWMPMYEITCRRKYTQNKIRNGIERFFFYAFNREGIKCISAQVEKWKIKGKRKFANSFSNANSIFCLNFQSVSNFSCFFF